MRDLSLDLKVKNGDFDLLTDEESLQQSEDIIIYSNKGNIINSPLLGVGIENKLNGPVSIPELNRTIKKELNKDNIKVVTFYTTGGEIYLKTKWNV